MSKISFTFALAFYIFKILIDTGECSCYDKDTSSENQFKGLHFGKQPENVCSIAKQANISCSPALNVNASINWHVYLNGVPINYPVNAFTITVECYKPPCNFKAWCTVTDGSNAIRSRVAFVELGGMNSCAARNFSVVHSKTVVQVIRANILSHVTLPCVGIVSSLDGDALFNSFWLFNGTKLPLAGDASDADGVYNIDRRLSEEFLVWANLTIYHLSQRHAGYYQCFLAGEEGAFNLIRLEVEGFENSDLKPLFAAPSITSVSFQDKWLQVTFTEPKLSSSPLRNIAVGIIRHRLSGANRCLGELGPGATTHYISAFLVSQSGDGQMTVAFDQLPDTFTADELLCDDFVAYWVFVKALAQGPKLTAVSELEEVPFPGDDNANQPFGFEVFDQKSGSTFVCVHSNKALGQLNNLDLDRLFPPERIPADAVPHQPIRIAQDCSCLNPNFENNSVPLSFDMVQVPFAISDLVPSTDYCFEISSDCYSYRTPEFANVLSYQRKMADTIEVTWQLPMCRNLGDDRKCHIKLKHIYLANRTDGDSVEVKTDGLPIPMTNEEHKLVEKCSGKVLFSHLANVNDTHDVVINCDDSDLVAKPIPPVLVIRNISAIVVSKSKILLHFTTNDIGAEKDATLSFTYFACPATSNVPSTTGSSSEEGALLSCLGCQQVKTASTTSLSTTSHYAEIYGFYEHVASLQIVIIADVILLINDIEDSAGMGILGTVLVVNEDLATDKYRPKEVHVKEFVKPDNDVEWNITWSAPEFVGFGFKLSSYEFVATPLSALLSNELESAGTLKLQISDSDGFLHIPNIADLLYERLNSKTLPFFDAVTACLKVPSEEYLMQVFPVWVPNESQGESLLNEFLGSASIPVLHKMNRVQDRIASKYKGSSANRPPEPPNKPSDYSEYDYQIGSTGSTDEDESSFTSALTTPVLVSLSVVMLIACAALFVPHGFKN